MSRNTRFTLALSSLTLLVSLSACTELATAGTLDPTVQVSTQRVKFGDLDLSHTQGAATLYTRIHSAARDVCRPAPFVGMFDSRKDHEKCMHQAIDRAVSDVDAPLLTSYYLAKSGRANLLAKQ